jgi:hypothetical protein
LFGHRFEFNHCIISEQESQQIGAVSVDQSCWQIPSPFFSQWNQFKDAWCDNYKRRLA